MSAYFFEASNERQYLQAIEVLKSLDASLMIKSKAEVDPFLGDMKVSVEVASSYKEVLESVSRLKNSERVIETIRPLN